MSARMKWIFAVRPRVCLTFSWGNIGSTLTSDSANERSRVSHKPPGVRNIGCGGAPASNQAPKRRANVIYDHNYIRKARSLEMKC